MRGHARARRLVLILVLATPLAIAGPVHAEQAGRGIVIDQTGLPLPGATIQLMGGATIVTTLITAGDGTFAIDPALGGARAHETPVLLDGFNVTDPATGNSSLNLPFEAVRGVDALRDPISVTYGDNLGGVVQIASRTGGDKFAIGVQGIVPRPRFATPGFGRLEGIFPRFHVSG